MISLHITSLLDSAFRELSFAFEDWMGDCAGGGGISVFFHSIKSLKVMMMGSAPIERGW